MQQLTRMVVAVGLYFLILFTANTAYANILTRIFEGEGETKLAPFNFLLNYGSFMVANLFAPLVKLPEKWLMAFASLFYGVNFVTGFFMFGDD